MGCCELNAGRRFREREASQLVPLEYDPTFNGPRDKRGCTDVLCLLFFLAFLVGWGGVGYYSFTDQKLDRLLTPIDFAGQRCGIDSAVLNKSFLQFFDLAKCTDPVASLTGCPTPQICVEKCPTTNFNFDDEACTSANFEQLKAKLICKGDKTNITDCSAIASSIKREYCAKWYLESISILKRCISDLPSTMCPRKVLQNQNETKLLLESNNDTETCGNLDEELIKKNMAKPDTFIGRVIGNIFYKFSNISRTHQLGQMIVDDLHGSWFIVLAGFVLSMVACLIFIAALKFLAKPTIWGTIVGVLALLGYGIYFSAARYVTLKNNPSKITAISPNIRALLTSLLDKETTWLYILIVLSVFTLIIVLIILVLRKRIVIAIALVKEGSKAVGSIKSTVFFPIVPWILQIAIIAFSFMVGLCLLSVGEEVYEVTGLAKSTTCVCNASLNYRDGEFCMPEDFNRDCGVQNNSLIVTHCVDAGCRFKHFNTPHLVPYYHGINALGLFWVVCFIAALGEMVLAATFATWYWTFQKSNVPYFTLTRGFVRTIRFNIGTLAFGSLIIAICQIVRAIIEYVDHKLRKYDNEVTRAIMCMFRCLFWCLEKFLRFVNRNAYIMCAIHGKNFCGSAKDALNLLLRNCLRVIALDQVSNFLFFLCKVLISLGMGACTYIFCGSKFSGLELHSEITPAIVVMIGSYLMSSVFFGVYSMAVETLFLCFLEDCERNDGTAEKPYFMSKQLMKILGKKNKFRVSTISNRNSILT